MTLGSVNITLRPLRLAFLVDPSDKAGVLEAIQINTSLWGGMFNPIVPVFRRTPKIWRERFERYSAKDVSEGLIQAFDPDYVVLVGKYSTLTINVGHRKVIHASEVLAKIEEDGTPSYGVSLFEVLNYLIHKELRFVRRKPLDVRLPSFAGSGSLFLASVLGSLPPKVQTIFDEQFAPVMDGKQVRCTLSNYSDFLSPEVLFPRRFGSLFLEPGSSGFLREDCVFLLDASSVIDVIEYWNLRAVGRHVIPVAIQTANSAPIRGLVEKFVDDNYRPLRYNKTIYNTTTFLKGRSITEGQLQAFGSSLKTKAPAAPAWGKFSYQHWYPRIWDEWARDKDGVEPAAIIARTRKIDFSDDTQINLRTLDPKFAFRYSANAEARFANEVELRTYGGKGLSAEVIPEGGENLSRAIGSYSLENWRFSRKGPVYLSRYLDWSVHVTVPQAEQVFISWLDSRGWQATLSPPGLIARQLLKQLNGIWGTSLLANESIIGLLDEMQQEKAIGLDALWAKLAKIANQFKFGRTSAGLLKQLIEAGVLRLGIEVQCPICTQHSWYSVTESDYKLQCRKCSEHFDLPTYSPKEIKWSYRTVGPFSLPGRAFGVYTVLLAYRFFSHLLDEPTTALLSFQAEKGEHKIEADLGLLLSETRYGRTTTEILFAECKTYDHFKRIDITRMVTLSKAFPGAVLVFATLRQNLTKEEKKLLRPLVNRGRKYWKADRPYNPVLILTGTELFGTFRPEYSWKEASPMHVEWAKKIRGHLSLLELCDATQQLYLDMKPWQQWLQERRELKRAKLAVRNTPVQSPPNV